MVSSPNPTPTPSSNPGRALRRGRWNAFVQGFWPAFHRYASWLVSISWKRFFLLSVLLIAITAILQSLPPFRYTVTEWVDEPIELPELPEVPEPPAAPQAPAVPAKPSATEPSSGGRETPAQGSSAPTESDETNNTDKKRGGIEISIDENGIRIRPRGQAPAAPAASGASAERAMTDEAGVEEALTIAIPQSATREVVREAIDEAKQAIREAAQDARAAQQDAHQAARDAKQAAHDALQQARRVLRDAGLSGATRKVQRTRTVHWGDFLTDLALIWILGSIIIKITYKGRLQAEVKAAQATETAEAESLRRQVVEARMAAMQAQVEPHFLFNTLASIDHLIETDPPRASQMQKNLIALLRASMPTMREAQDSAAPRDLGRELAVIRPYLEILKVRMEERLSTSIEVPDGLMSAEFPPMMIQTLVENAIKHGLEPKPEGGSLQVKAEIVHGKLAVSVTDTGLGFGKAATAGTGVGLANIRERLQMLYGAKAVLTVAENPGGGTAVTITVPYKALDGERA
jgi:signal transduction histidine kinase